MPESDLPKPLLPCQAGHSEFCSKNHHPGVGRSKPRTARGSRNEVADATRAPCGPKGDFVARRTSVQMMVLSPACLTSWPCCQGGSLLLPAGPSVAYISGDLLSSASDPELQSNPFCSAYSRFDGDDRAQLSQRQVPASNWTAILSRPQSASQPQPWFRCRIVWV